MSKSFTYDKERICYVFEHYTGNKNIVFKNLTVLSANTTIEPLIICDIECNENVILELLDGLPDDHINLTFCFTTLLLFAIKYEHIKVINYILNNYDTIDLNYPYLNHSLKTSNKDIFKLFLNHENINPNVKDVFGYTVLFNAVYNSNIEYVKLLLNHPQIDVSITYYKKICNNNTPTILEYAKFKGDGEIIRLLEEYEQKKLIN